MDKIFSQATEQYCSELTRQIETQVQGVRVNNLGSQLVLHFDNKSVATVYPVTNSACDIFAKDNQEREHEWTGISWQECLGLLKELSQIPDGNAPSQWWNEKYPVGHQSASFAEGERKPFGPDPLGRNERRQGRCLQESTLPRIVYGSELFRYLKEVLPVAEDEVFVDGAGNFIVAVEPLLLRIIPKGANLYDVETFVGEKREPQQVQLSHGETLRYVFDLVWTAKNVDFAHPESGTTAEKVKWFRGLPVAFGEAMHGKTLRYVQHVGAVLVPIAETTNRPSWKPFR